MKNPLKSRGDHTTRDGAPSRARRMWGIKQSMTMLWRRDTAAPVAIEPQLALEEVVAAPNLDAAIKLVETQYNFRAHPYFLWIDARTTSSADFYRSQLPFRFA